MITISQEFLDELIETKQELKKLKRKPHFGFRILFLSMIFGWVGMPILAVAVMNSFIPTPVKEVITAANVAYSDLALNLQCSYKK